MHHLYNKPLPVTILPPPKGTAHQTARVALLLFGGISLIYLAFLKPLTWSSDGNEVLQVARSLVLYQNISVPPVSEGLAGVGGEHYSIRYPLLPVVITPLVAVGLSLSHWLNLPEIPVISACGMVSSVVFTAATAALVFLLAVRLGGSKSGAYIAALSFAFGTIALTYAQTLFAEPLLALITIASVYLAMGCTQTAWGAAILLGCLAILAKPPGVVVAPILSIYWALKRRSLFVVLAPLLALGLGILLYLGYNYLRFGDPWTTGQPVSGALGLVGMPKRLWGMLFSPGRGGGLLWYCPPIALAVVGGYKAMRSKPVEVLALVGICAAYLGLYSLWAGAGWDWGPRFLVPTVPLLMALTGLIGPRDRAGLIALSVIGFLINAPTLVSFYERYYWELLALGSQAPYTGIWGPISHAPIFHAWGAALRQINDALSSSPQVLLTAADGDVPVAMQIVTTWWWVLPAVGLPLWLGGLGAGLMIAAGIVMLRQGLLTAYKYK